ncbi:MAG TPA: HAMP domain-containing sensor histidine kinase, partial [Chryseolinea sp.]|nr:HAMP domain-containing sensor histidine kinase [Chryseolinea sp.]
NGPLISCETRLIICSFSRVKGPLNRVFALVQLIQMEGDNLTDDQVSYLSKMHLVVADGLGMIRNLVDYRNLVYKRTVIIPEEMDLALVIRPVAQHYFTLASKKNIQLFFESPSSLMIQSDNHCVVRSVENLISNAVKFSAEGKKVFVTLTSKPDGASISVRDEARGFTKDDQTKMFGKFQKLSALPTSGESATGLGLLIVKLMLDKIKGNLQYVTTEGVGSVFTMNLPLRIS